MDDAVIALAAAEELPAVLELLVAHELPTDGLEAQLATLLVARVGERVVGSAALEPYPPAALLRSLITHREVRGLGLGRRLVDAALQLAEQRRLREIYLLTETAEPFFSRLGFVRIQRSRVLVSVRTSLAFTSACPLDATVMHLTLPVVGDSTR